MLAPKPLVIWAAVAVATIGLLFRPFRIPEYVWALCAAALLPLLGAVSLHTAWGAVAEGRDVYLFLVGMMVLAELARREGLFDWVALYAVRHAGGSGRRLFDLVFLVGTLVTVFLSNDATAVVLTPAVAACKAARANPCPTCSSVPSSPMRPASCCPFQSGQPGGVRPAHATAAAVAGAVRAAVGGGDRCHLPGAALGAPARDRPAAGGRAGTSPVDRRRPAERTGRAVHRHRVAGHVRLERAIGPDHVLRGHAECGGGGDPPAAQPAATAAPRVLGRAAAGGGTVRAGGSGGTDRCHQTAASALQALAQASPARPAGWPVARLRC